jgi:hypothetical protein
MHSSQASWRCSLLVVLLVFSCVGCIGPASTGVAHGVINTSGDPLQVITDLKPITLTKDGYAFTLTPRAYYTAPVVVVRKESYSTGWQSELSPFDAVFAWGDMAEPGADSYVRYVQGSRFYWFTYTAGSPFDGAYITSHTSNNHLIPANDNVYAAVRSIPDGEKAVFSGFLVDVDGAYGNREVWWRTSLDRADTGNGACEIFYVTSVRIGDDVFT